MPRLGRRAAAPMPRPRHWSAVRTNDVSSSMVGRSVRAVERSAASPPRRMPQPACSVYRGTYSPSVYHASSVAGWTILTSRDYNLVMSDVRIADLKARLSEHLRSVRNGRMLTVLDRDTPIARIVPYSAQPLEIRKAKRRLRDLKLPPRPSKRTDSVGLLLEDRRHR